MRFREFAIATGVAGLIFSGACLAQSTNASVNSSALPSWVPTSMYLSGCSSTDPRAGCLKNPFLRKCDYCLPAQEEQRALAAATHANMNHVYVVDRPAVQVYHYLVFVDYEPGGVHKSAALIEFDTPEAVDVRNVLTAAAILHNWFADLTVITQDDLESAGIPVTIENAMDFASGYPGSATDLGHSLEQWVNNQAAHQSFISAINAMAQELVQNLMDALFQDILPDDRPSEIFKWSNGSTIEVDFDIGMDLVDAQPNRGQ